MQAAFPHEAVFNRPAQERIHRVIIAVDIENADGLVELFELFQRQNLKKFLVGADSARND